MPRMKQVSHYWFFGYGPEVNPDVIRSLGLNVFQEMRAILMDHEMVFTRPSPKAAREGMSDLLSTTASVVEGMLYEIADAGLGILDKYFNVGRMVCRRKSIQVVADDGELVTAAVYVGVRSLAGLRPSKAYLDQILEGARARGFSPATIEKLSKIAALEER